MVACCGAALAVLLVFKASLQAPFLVPKFAALEVTAALGVVAFVMRRAATGRPKWTFATSAGAALVFATTGLAALAACGRATGAPYAIFAMSRWGCLFGLACGASVLDDVPDERQRVLETMTIAAAAVAAIGLLQHINRLPIFIPVLSRPGSTFGNRNQAAEVIAMAMPFGLAAAVRGRSGAVRAAMFASIALELFFLGVTRTRGAWLGGASGLAATMALARPRWSRVTVAAAVGAVSLACVAAALPGPVNPYDIGDRKRYSGVLQILEEGFDAHSTALRTRLGLWRRTLQMVREHPIVGIGAGNWPVVFPRFAEPGAGRDGVLSATLAPREAHNDLLERTAETGFLGLAALVLLSAGAASAVRRRLQSRSEETRFCAASAGGALVALVALSLTSFPLEMPATIAFAGLSLGFVASEWGASASSVGVEGPTASLVEPSRSRTQATDRAAIVAGLALLCFAAVRAERSVRSSGCLGAAERAMGRERRTAVLTTEALDALRCALRAEPENFRARLGLSQELARAHRSVESAYAARQALEIEPYSPNAWVALAAAELDSSHFVLARRDATTALTLLRDFPLALQIRAQAAEHIGDAASASADRALLSEIASRPENDDTTRTARTLIQGGKQP
jgi:O-antigen ligase